MLCYTGRPTDACARPASPETLAAHEHGCKAFQQDLNSQQLRGAWKPSCQPAGSRGNGAYALRASMRRPAAPRDSKHCGSGCAPAQKQSQLLQPQAFCQDTAPHYCLAALFLVSKLDGLISPRNDPQPGMMPLLIARGRRGDLRGKTNTVSTAAVGGPAALRERRDDGSACAPAGSLRLSAAATRLHSTQHARVLHSGFQITTLDGRRDLCSGLSQA